MHTILGIGAEGLGYPMGSQELKETFSDYMKDNVPELLESCEINTGGVSDSIDNIKKLIDANIPVAIILYSYDSSVGEGKYHDVIAYGYKGDTLLSHFGWSPNSTTYAEVKVSSANLIGHFAINYSGPHRHSRNVFMMDGDDKIYFCGCGSEL